MVVVERAVKAVLVELGHSRRDILRIRKGRSGDERRAGEALRGTHRVPALILGPEVQHNKRAVSRLWLRVS